jgi:mono/diheme cytochrome c family protein
MMRSTRVALVACIVSVLVVGPALEAAADHLVVDVSGPEAADLGERAEIRVSVRSLESGDPEEGVVVIFYSDAVFAGVSGEIELGRATTDGAGLAIIPLTFHVSGTHAIRIEAVAGPEVQPESVSIPVTVGGQQVRAEAGVSIPGFGGWIVTAIIGLVWAIMVVAVFSTLRLVRAGRQKRSISLAHIVLVIMVLAGSGLVILLLRSPETHSNLNPEGYNRTAVAFTEADYLYRGPGLTSGVTAEQSVAYGRAIFVSRGCAGCHGINAEGAATAGSPAEASREWLGSVVRSGMGGVMPAYSEVDLSGEDLDAIFVFLFASRNTLDGETAPTTSTPTTTATPTTTTAASTTAPTSTAAPTTTDATDAAGAPTFTDAVAPIFAAYCEGCHGTQGGWDASSLEAALTTGDSAPVVIPGDADGSLLAQKIQGTQSTGLQMPPGELMTPEEIRTIVDWINAGAP